MKLKFILIGLCIILSLSFISSMGDPALAYCEHMGYEHVNYENCSFGDGNSCPLWDFFKGSCGQDYVKEIPCRKQGEDVFASFEECCGNLKPYLPSKLLGQASCQPPSKVIIDEFKYNPLYWLGTLIVLGIIVYVIYRKVKRKK